MAQAHTHTKQPRNETNNKAAHDKKQELGRGNMPRDAIGIIHKILHKVIPWGKKKKLHKCLDQ